MKAPFTGEVNVAGDICAARKGDARVVHTRREHFARQSGDTLTLAFRARAEVTPPAVRARVTQALGPFRGAPHVTGVTDPYRTPGHLSADGHIGYAAIAFGVPSTGIPGGEVTALMHDAIVASGHGVTFSLGGDVVGQAETPYGGSSNGIGVGAAAIVLLIAFGSLLAMLVDATVVRLVLVPAAMELLGRANWWLPPWLERRLPGGRVAVMVPGQRPVGV